MSELSRLRGSEGYVICSNVSTKCLPKNTLNSLGRNGFKNYQFSAVYHGSTNCIFSEKKLLIWVKSAAFLHFSESARVVIQGLTYNI